MSTRQTIINTADRLDALPPLAVELIAVLQSDDADVNEVAQIIAHDPANAANVLKLANSAASAPATPITAIKSAVMRIGLRRTAQLVLRGVVSEHLGRPVQGYDLASGDLHLFSAAAAIATEKLAHALHQPEPAEAYTAGLLQDLGKLVLGHYVQADGPQIRRLAFDQNLSFEEAERQVLGIDHAEVGAILLKRWGIGGRILDAVRWHHQPEQAPEASRFTAELVHVAGQIVNLAGIGMGSDGCHYRPSAEALCTLEVSPRIVERVMRETVTQLESVKGLSQPTH